MKELSIEEKSKRYDKALERARGVIEQNPLMEYLKKGIEYILPELRESEDERIKSAAIEFVIQNKSFNYYLGISKDDVVTWINRQGEQNPTWSEEDYKYYDKTGQYLVILLGRTTSSDEIEGIDSCIEWLKSIRERVQPQSQWKPSDEQMNALNDVISSRDIKYDVLSELWTDLKKLKEEQL